MLYTYIAVLAGTLGRSANMNLLLPAFGVAVIGSGDLGLASPSSAALIAVPSTML
ncbi:hypothetical protein IAE35_00685 [Pseudomonas sp. S75]|uniref:hypothetical protein n=1 Tax=unclassified Pseudomonas TaxID=196821 RepID=UPI001903FB2A|nr:MULTISPECIES: hypothetical protein [unclassified Pseudomonas]MBJ9974220.1 hypothetical protein [Pseudomonas sp. S30]MBK0151850.1 hypothetical protein [Pseudomonas sp. S75]